jgi:hypothetical protein
MIKRILSEKIEQTPLVVGGIPTTVETPLFDLGDYLIRAMRQTDIPNAAVLNDPSLSDQLSEGLLLDAYSTGYSCIESKRGYVFFVAEEKASGKLAGRADVKTWTGPLNKPKLRETHMGGLEVIAGEELLPNAKKIVELGGWLVPREYRGEGLAHALAYISARFIDEMQPVYAMDAAFITNVGPFRSRDNSQSVNYIERIEEVIRENNHLGLNEPLDLSMLTSRGEILSKIQVENIFHDLKMPWIIAPGKIAEVGYFLGMPRSESAPAWRLTGKLAAGDSALLLDSGTDGHDVGRLSPLSMKQTNILHPEHGGSYTISLFRQ